MVDQLDALVAEIPETPFGPMTRSMLIRACLAIGIKTIAEQNGVVLPGVSVAKPAKKNGARVASKTASTAKTSSIKRAAERARIRQAAGCTCTHSHVRTCKLYRHPSAGSSST